MSEGRIYPFDPHRLLRHKKSLRRGLIEQPGLLEKRIAILGGSTTAEVKDMLELFLLQDGVKPVFYESEYNRYFEEAMFPNKALRAFAPEIVYIHTTNRNINCYPSPGDRDADVTGLIANEVSRFVGIWERITSEYSCPVIQNNFELPRYRLFGNLDASQSQGRTAFVAELNRRLSNKAGETANIHINDINYLSAWFGLERWYDNRFWHSSKYAMSIEAIPFVAHSVASIIRGLLGKSKKCLVLDLDNTLWGGTIGDDGIGGIRIGQGTAEAEAFSEFQTYVKLLKERGVILAVCSKNDDENAREALTHPDGVLRIDDFSLFRANWKPKHENLREIASGLNIDLDSIVFVDDNAVERDLMRSELPRVGVLEMGNSITTYIDVIDKSGLFEAVTFTRDDLLRNSYYAQNATRDDARRRHSDYGEYLSSLEMVAEIKPFAGEYVDRITQLINKTNQFNLTTRRYTQAEVEKVLNDEHYITLYGRLKDRFGDNGLVSVIIGAICGRDLNIDLWVMSCRVFQRTLEASMLDSLVLAARSRGLERIVGCFHATAKNGIVSNLFRDLGFVEETGGETHSMWSLDLALPYTGRGKVIAITS